MNQKKRLEYWMIHKRRMEHFEKLFVPKVFKAIRPQIDKFIEIMRAEGVEAAKRWLHKQVMTPELMPVLEDLYKIIGAYFANQTRKEIIAAAKQMEEKR